MHALWTHKTRAHLHPVRQDEAQLNPRDRPERRATGDKQEDMEPIHSNSENQNHIQSEKRTQCQILSLYHDFVLWIIIYSVFDCFNCWLNKKIIVVCVIITIVTVCVCVHIHCVCVYIYMYIYIYIKLHIYCIVWVHVCGVILYNYFILFYTPIYSIYF